MHRALIECPALGPVEEIHELTGREALGELFEYCLSVPLAHPAALRGREAELLESPISLLFEDEGEIVSRVHGIAREVKIRVSPNLKTGSVELWLVPRVWVLTQSVQSRIFLDRSIPEILAETLAAAGFEEHSDFVLALQDRYPTREIVVQYRESDLDFLARLCEHVGITLFFRHDSGKDRLFFTDSGDVHEAASVPGGAVRYEPEDDRRAAFEVVETLRRVPGRVLVHDYNYRSPRVALTAALAVGREAARGAVVEYGDHAKSPDEITRLACVRAEEHAAGQRTVTARTRQLALRAGSRFTLEDASGAEQRLLVTRVEVRSHHEGPTSGEAKAWHNQITAIPEHTPFRPPRRTPRPRVEGLIHAVIDGAIRGPYAEIDDRGRYRVRFNYDVSGRPEMHATHPVRMMQPHAGPRYGMHFPLRAGTEVLIGFVEGDPDRPVIVGAVPNPITPSPVEQANLTHNVLRTGSGNEIVLDDVVEQERIRIHTPRESTTLQMGHADEPEQGALLTTRASVTVAAGQSINQHSPSATTVAWTSASLIGDTSVTVAGIPSLEDVAEKGLHELGNLHARRERIERDLARIAAPPGRREASPEPEPPPAGAATDQGRLWSELDASLSEAARHACLSAVRAAAEAADITVHDSRGRRTGEPAGQPGAPAAITASPETAALIARREALVFGEKVVSVSSTGSVQLAGSSCVEVKSPGTVEIAGALETLVTSAGTVDAAAGLVRIVGGYYPEKEAPELDDGTSVGVMARRDLRLTSVDDCIVACAQKNVVATAHTGEMRLRAEKQVAIRGGSVQVTGGSIALSGGDVTVRASGDIGAKADGNASLEAGGHVTIKGGGTVMIEGGSIVLKGPVTVLGNLHVEGNITGG